LNRTLEISDSDAGLKEEKFQVQLEERVSAEMK